MTNRKTPYWILIVGIAVIASTWFSIGPSSENRWKLLLERKANNPDLVLPDESVMRDQDESGSLLLLLIISTPLFLISLILAMIVIKIKGWNRTVIFLLGFSWIILGGLMHAFIWTGEAVLPEQEAVTSRLNPSNCSNKNA